MGKELQKRHVSGLKGVNYLVKDNGSKHWKHAGGHQVFLSSEGSLYFHPVTKVTKRILHQIR